MTRESRARGERGKIKDREVRRWGKGKKRGERVGRKRPENENGS